MYPILLEFGFITIFALWLFIAIGFTVASYVFIQLAKRNRIKLNILADNTFFLFFSALIVSRICFVIFNYDLFFYQFELKNFLNVFAVWDKGLSFWGAIIGWMGGIFYIARKRGESPLRLIDIMVPAILCGMVFGDIGALLDGVNYGTPTNLPWGVVFRSANVKYITPIHPTQLYGAVYAAGLAVGLYFLLKKLRDRLPGFVSEVALFSFCFLRFSEEFIRGDETLEIFTMRFPLLAAFAGMAVGAYLIYRRYTNRAGGDPERVLKTFVAQVLSKIPKSSKTQDPAEMSAKMNCLPNRV